MLDVTDIEVTPLSQACGAEIKGVDLTQPLPERTVRAIKEAWGQHLVLVFRGQKLTQDAEDAETTSRDAEHVRYKRFIGDPSHQARLRPAA